MRAAVVRTTSRADPGGLVAGCGLAYRVADGLARRAGGEAGLGLCRHAC